MLTLFKEGWAALPQFGAIDRAAILVVSASMVPYSPPIHPHVRIPPPPHYCVPYSQANAIRTTLATVKVLLSLPAQVWRTVLECLLAWSCSRLLLVYQHT